MLGDEGEGESDDSDPVLVTGEASVGGSAGVSAGTSSFSHSTNPPALLAPPPRPRNFISAATAGTASHLAHANMTTLRLPTTTRNTVYLSTTLCHVPRHVRVS